MNIGWKCPQCGACLAPQVTVCNHNHGRVGGSYASVPTAFVHCIACGVQFETPNEVTGLIVYCAGCRDKNVTGHRSFERYLPEKGKNLPDYLKAK